MNWKIETGLGDEEVEVIAEAVAQNATFTKFRVLGTPP